MRADAIVLGAGIVGVSIAVHLRKRGLSVVLVDRGEAGAGTSYGNAGLIQREAVVPYAFPRDLPTLLRIARNRSSDARYDPRFLIRLMPFLARYWWHSAPKRHADIARLYAPLIAHALDQHRSLAEEAGAAHLIRPGGWTLAFRTPAALQAALAVAETTRREFGVGYAALDPTGLAAAEPHLAVDRLAGAVHWTDAASLDDPQGLTLAYLAHFERLGGTFVRGDATTLSRDGGTWRVRTQAGEVGGDRAVLALGPWANTVTERLGYRFPLAVKRGYHRHFRSGSNAGLSLPVLDAERGVMMAPMRAGLRLTTGAEFAHRDAAPTPLQAAQAEASARELVELGTPVEAQPWMGARPCTPDMRPIIGPASRHAGLWFAFGHAHHGLTLGPATGALVAQMMTGEVPLVDPAPYRPDRFRGARGRGALRTSG